MSLKQQIDKDIKQAMLGGDKTLTETLRGLKSAILYAEVAKGQKEQGLADPDIVEVLSKEVKKRQESADLYKQGGNQAKANAELVEKEAIQKYLPAQLSEEAVKKLVDEIVAEHDEKTPQMMGQIIGAVRQKAGAGADGAVIARLVKERLSS